MTEDAASLPRGWIEAWTRMDMRSLEVFPVIADTLDGSV